MRIIPEVRPDGIYLHVMVGSGVDIVGPLQDGEELVAIVEQADLSPGRVAPSKKVKRRSNKQEREIAEAIGGKTHKASGALAHLKGDVRKKGTVRVEAKMTGNKSFPLTREILDKIRGEASDGEVPTVVIDFLNKHTAKKEDSWAVIPTPDWEEKIANASRKN